MGLETGLGHGIQGAWDGDILPLFQGGMTTKQEVNYSPT